jgi:integrase
LFSQIDAKFEREFREFIFDYKGLKINSYYTYMATMIPVLKYALEEKVLTDRSFLSFKHKPQQADKFALTEEEINRIWSVETNYKVREYCKMLFVFCCSSGLRFHTIIFTYL